MPKKLSQDIIISKGLDLRTPDELIDNGSARKLENVVLDRTGVPSKMQGYVRYNPIALADPIDSLHEYVRDDGTKLLLTIGSDKLNKTSGDGVMTSITTGLNSAELYEFATARDRAYFVNGGEAHSTDGADLRDMGLVPPVAPITANNGAGGLVGEYRWAISYLYDGFQESSIGPTSLSLTAATNSVDLSSIPIGGTGVTARKIYRTKAGGVSPYFFVATINDNTTTVYNDNLADSGLVVEASTDVLPLTPASSFILPRKLVYHANRMWAAGISGELDAIYLSDPLEPDKFRVNNFLRVQGLDNNVITAIHPFYDTLLVFTDNSINAIRGVFSGDVTGMRMDNIAFGIGCNDSRSINTILLNGVPTVVFADKKAYYAYNGNNVSAISDKIEPEFRALGQITTVPGSNSQSTLADFTDAYSKSPSIDIASVPGSVQIDTGKNWTTDSDWTAGTITGVSSIGSGSITLIKTIQGFDDFNNGNFTSPRLWTVGDFGSWTVISDDLRAIGDGIDNNNIITTPSTKTSGTWTHTFGNNGSACGHTISIMADNTGGLRPTNGYTFMIDRGFGYNIAKVVGGVETILSTAAVDVDTQSGSVTITRTAAGAMELTVNGSSKCTASNNEVTTSSYFRIFADNRAGGDRVNFDRFDRDGLETGTWESEVIDTTTDKTAWGQFAVSEALDGGTIVYEIRSGPTAVPDGSWTAYSTITTATTITEPLNRYVQTKASLSATENAGTLPRLDNVDIDWAATGTIEGVIIDTGPDGPQGWSTFVGSISDLGAGISFEMRTGPDDGGGGFGAWTAYSPVTNETIPALGIGLGARYVQWKSILISTIADPEATLDSVITQWFVQIGLDRGRVSSQWSDELLYFTARTDTDSDINDKIFILDKLGRWTSSDIKAKVFERFNDELFFAGEDEPNTKGVLYKFERNTFSREDVAGVPLPTTSTIETGNKPWVEAELADNDKLFRTLWLNTTSTDNFSISANPDETGFVTDITVPGGQSVPVQVSTRGKRQKIRVTHTGTNDFILWKISPSIFVFPKRKG